MLAPIVVCVFMVAHSAGSSLPGFSRMSSMMPTLPTSCRALACRSRSACTTFIPTSRASRSHRRPMRSMCTPVSASRHSTATPSRWAISRSASARSAVRSRTRCSSSSLSRVTRWRTRRSASSLQAIAPKAPVRSAKSGAATSMMLPLSKRNWAPTRKPAPATTRHGAHRAQREAPARERREHREQSEQQDVHAYRCRSQREAVQRGPDRVRLNLGARHQLLTANRRRVDVAECRRGGAHDHDVVADHARGHAPSFTSTNETVGIVPGGPRKSIQALPSRKPSAGGGCP